MNFQGFAWSCFYDLSLWDMNDILNFAPRSFGYLFCSGKKVRCLQAKVAGKWATN